MSTIAQVSLFSWEHVERSPEIVRLRRLLDALPDHKLVAALEAGRKGKRNEYRLQAMWRAGVALGHATTASACPHAPPPSTPTPPPRSRTRKHPTKAPDTHAARSP